VKLTALPIVRAWRLSRLAACNDGAARRPTLVEPGIWLGGIPSRRRWRALRDAGVTDAVCLVEEGPPPRWMSSAEQLLWLPVVDNHAPNREQLAAGCGFLDGAREQGRTVFVFCGAGLGRAPTLYLAWRATRPGETLDAAMARLHTARSGLRITGRQLAALHAWSADPRGTGRALLPRSP
jgi:Dual specificity phosphatase, catalytic domain